MALTPWLSHFKTDFELARRRRQESIAFDALRCEAFDRFLVLGCPTQADDQWRFIDISPIAEANFTLGAEPAADARPDRITPSLCGGNAGIELAFINGYFVQGTPGTHELPDGALVASLHAVLAAEDRDVGSYFAQIARVDCLPFVALNTALFEDGACVVVPPHSAIDIPIHLRFVCNGEADSRPAMTQPRALIIVGDGGAATIVESYTGADGAEYFTNGVTEIVLGERARLEHYRVQRESADAYHIGAAHVIAGAHSTYSTQCINAGGALARGETMVTLAGDAAECSVRATSVAGRNGRVNVHTAIDHATANCVSRQRYRWSLTDNACGILSGRTIVRPEAGNARVRLANRAQLLSSNARMDVKPALDLLANDVDFCSRIRTNFGRTRVPGQSALRLQRGGGMQWQRG